MLAFDIETTGLDPASSVVTVVCTEDFHTGERRAYEFGRVRMCEPQNEELLRSELIQAFDEAESLCAFNGVRFDIPFLHTTLKLSDDTTTSWLFKTTDILEAARLGIFGPTHTFGLNLLCQHNNVSVKSGSGLQAIQFAREQKWEELKSYCADDVRILCDLYRRRLLNNPRFHHVIDLSTIAHASTYFLKSKEKQEHPVQTVRVMCGTYRSATKTSLLSRTCFYVLWCRGGSCCTSIRECATEGRDQRIKQEVSCLPRVLCML
jgi:hypothetical protein